MDNMPDVIVLCGGAGLRLRSVTGDAPKSMANIAGRPFLELILRQISRNGFRRVILAVGYQKDAIRAFFGESFENLEVVYSEELTPLGTGGALRNSADLVRSDTVLIMNGDSYTDADLEQFVVNFRQAGPDISVLVVPADGRVDCGTVLVDAKGQVTLFGEKTVLEESRYINAGIYLLSRQMLYDIPDGVQTSFEHELMPSWLKRNIPAIAFVHQGACLDIGTPDRYRSAQELLRNMEMGEEASTAQGAQL